MFQLAFAKLQSAFVVQEYITIIDNTVSLNTFSDPFTNITTARIYFYRLSPSDPPRTGNARRVLLGSRERAYAGVCANRIETQAAHNHKAHSPGPVGVSALVYANSVSNLNGTIPAAGIQILVDSIEGKVNVPAHRRRLMSAGPETPPKVAPMQEPEVMSVPRKLTQTVRAWSCACNGSSNTVLQLSAADVAGLTFSGFWEQLQNIIPPRLLTNLTKLLAASSRPVDEFLALSQTTPEQCVRQSSLHSSGSLSRIPVQACRGSSCVRRRQSHHRFPHETGGCERHSHSMPGHRAIGDCTRPGQPGWSKRSRDSLRHPLLGPERVPERESGAIRLRLVRPAL